MVKPNQLKRKAKRSVLPACVTSTGFPRAGVAGTAAPRGRLCAAESDLGAPLLIPEAAETKAALFATAAALSPVSSAALHARRGGRKDGLKANLGWARLRKWAKRRPRAQRQLAFPNAGLPPRSVPRTRVLAEPRASGPDLPGPSAAGLERGGLRRWGKGGGQCIQTLAAATGGSLSPTGRRWAARGQPGEATGPRHGAASAVLSHGGSWRGSGVGAVQMCPGSRDHPTAGAATERTWFPSDRAFFCLPAPNTSRAASLGPPPPSPPAPGSRALAASTCLLGAGPPRS